MDLNLILSFLLASLALTLLPGPDLLFVLTESITKGSKNGIAIATGLSLGCLIHTIAVATGLSLFVQTSPLAFSVIKYLGAGYLFYLAFKASQENMAEVQFTENNDKKQDFHFFPLFKTGLLMNVLNPKVSIFFIAFLPQFTSSHGFDISFQMILLGLIFMLQAIIVFSLVAVLSGRLHHFIDNERFWVVTKWTKVAILTILGIGLFLSKK